MQSKPCDVSLVYTTQTLVEPVGLQTKNVRAPLSIDHLAVLALGLAWRCRLFGSFLQIGSGSSEKRVGITLRKEKMGTFGKVMF